MDSKAAEHVQHLPFFVTGPGETDILLTSMIIFTLALVLLIGVFYFYLHSLPERMAHDTNSMQLQLVGILVLLALFTHNNIFWVAALLIVAVKVPDFLTPLISIARSLRRIAGRTAPSAERIATTTEKPQLTDGSPAPDAAPPSTPQRENEHA